MRRIVLATVVLGSLAACQESGTTAAPSAADLSTTSHTALFDRAAVLADAVAPEAAEAGPSLDLRAAGEGYLLEAYDGETITGGTDEIPRSYGNYVAGVAGVIAVDLTTAVVLVPPAASLAIAADGTVAQTAPNVWEATHTIDLLGEDVTTHLTVSWIGIGWVSEMRITNDTMTDQLWFNGFVTNDRSVGWWDFYENGTTHAAVVEWTTDGIDGQFGYGALVGDYAGDVVLYASVGGTGTVSVYDASEDELVWISQNADASGSVRLLDYNYGLEACWDANLQDAPC